MRYRHLKYTILSLTVILIISISSFNFPNSFLDHNRNDKNNNLDQVEDEISYENLKNAATQPNGKPLLIQQHANITKSYNGISTGENVSFPIVKGWTSKNVSINYEGVSKKKDYVVNGDLATTMTGWTYAEIDTNSKMVGDYRYWQGLPPGSYRIILSDENYVNGDKSYIYQNHTIADSLVSNIATLSCEVIIRGSISYPPNGSFYMAVIANGIEKNHTIDMESFSHDIWTPISMQYNPISFGQVLPGDISIRVGIIIDQDCTKIPTLPPTETRLLFDNIKFELWTHPNEPGVLKALDTEFSQNYTYVNTTYGEGYTLIDVERSRSSTEEIIFTINENITESLLDFNIDTITIESPAIKFFNSTYLGTEGTFYTVGENIKWGTDFSITIPNYYTSWVEIEKPIDWLFTSIIDGYEFNQTNNCLGKEIGSNLLIIPSSYLDFGQWKLEAISNNYISNGAVGVWNRYAFEDRTQLTLNDIFQVNVTLNDTLTLSNTQINSTIFNPNGSIFWQCSKEPTSYNEKFGNFTVGNNMTVGNYLVRIEGVNSLSSIEVNKIGYIELNFNVWHHTNLTAVDFEIEKIAGDPCLIKVNYTDYDLDTNIAFAMVTYNSTFGQSGSMIYIGSGTYFLDLDTSSLGIGDYYFSFNASKTYYENQSAKDLIHLKIIAQPLAIEVPGSAVNAMGNDYAICDVNVTGALTGTPIYPANVSTDWTRWYNVTDNDDGSYSLNFSTDGIPTQGILQSFTINIFANKTDYGSTSNFITLIVHPISTRISVNESLYNLYLNEIFYVKINYTNEASGTHISGASWIINWSSNYDVTPVADGYIVCFDTIGLTIEAHTALIKLEHLGYETEYTSVTVIVNSQKVNITLSINSQQVQENYLIECFFNDIISLSSRAYVEAEHTYLENCTLTFINDNYEKNLTETVNYWHNTSIEISTSDFKLGNNYVYIKFTRANYSAVSFSFQILVKQISIHVDIIDFEDSIEAFAGETITIEIKLTEKLTGKPIEDADISYDWEFGVGEFEEKDDGVYKVKLEIPENIEGNYDLDLIITASGSVYKSTEEDFTITVKARELPEYWIWIIIVALSVGVGLLAAISLRAYVFLPRARKKESELLAKTQNFKDMKSINAIVLIHRDSGLPIYYKTYSFLEKVDAHLFSGFVQAITTIGKEIAESDKGAKSIEKQRKYAEHMMEIDFKYFYALIYDQEDLRIVLILSERSSDEMREKLKDLSTNITNELSDSIKNFSGLLEPFELAVPSILSKSIDLHYKEFFNISSDNALFLKTKKERDFSSMETRLFNVLTSYSKGGNNFALESIFKMISEKNEDLIIEAIESLIQRKLIIPTGEKAVFKSPKGNNYK